jgi:hypothetical protein
MVQEDLLLAIADTHASTCADFMGNGASSPWRHATS